MLEDGDTTWPPAWTMFTSDVNWEKNFFFLLLEKNVTLVWPYTDLDVN